MKGTSVWTVPSVQWTLGTSTFVKIRKSKFQENFKKFHHLIEIKNGKWSTAFSESFWYHVIYLSDIVFTFRIIRIFILITSFSKISAYQLQFHIRSRPVVDPRSMKSRTARPSSRLLTNSFITYYVNFSETILGCSPSADTVVSIDNSPAISHVH